MTTELTLVRWMGGAVVQPRAAKKLLLVQPIRILASTEMDGESSAAAYGSGEIVIGSADLDTEMDGESSAAAYGSREIVIGSVDPDTSLYGDGWGEQSCSLWQRRNCYWFSRSGY